MEKKKRGRVNILEAVDNLSHLADLDVEKKETPWMDPAKMEENQEVIRETFRTLTAYLHHVYQKERTELKNPQTQKGLKAMMQLAGEAVEKVDKYTRLFKGTQFKGEPIPEYRQLQQFYLSKVFSKVKQIAADEPWEYEGFETGLEEERRALKDLEAVQQDHEYELFYISQEDGSTFFTPNLLRHIRMLGNFDESLSSPDREDVLKRMDVILDRDFHVSAQEILQEARDLLYPFLKEAFHHKHQEAPGAILKCCMALFLAANPKNLLHNTKGKSSADYFTDFEFYLRKAIDSDDYAQWRVQEKQPPFKTLCVKLIHFLSQALILRSGARHEIITFVKELIRNRFSEHENIWATLTSMEHALQHELKKYPNGPLLKILKIFRLEEEKKGFDPLVQQNPPSSIFNLASETTHATIVHLPCPTHQDFIDRATIVPEFKAYLRSLGDRKHLLVNLQDKNSWREKGRSSALENLTKEGEFAKSFQLLNLTKDSHFYHQTDEFADIRGPDFLKQFVKELPEILPAIIEDLVEFVHEQFFQTRKELPRKDRLDFIEIFYFFLTLRTLDVEKADIVSFTCKDAVDTGAAMAGSFYGFARMLSTNQPWTEEDRNLFLFAFFGPALLIRHRSIDSSRFNRSISALDHFESILIENRDKLLSACAQLFPEIPLKNIKISEVS